MTLYPMWVVYGRKEDICKPGQITRKSSSRKSVNFPGKPCLYWTITRISLSIAVIPQFFPHLADQQCLYSKGNQIPGAVRRPARAYATPRPPPPSYSGGSGVTVPGQYVNGKWVPEHRVQDPSSSREQVPAPGPPASQRGPYAPTPP